MSEANTGSRLLPRDANDLLARLWQRVQRNERSLARADLRDTARKVSLEARVAGLNAAELIVAVKVSWLRAGPRRSGRERPRLDDHVLTEVIAMCVTEFCRDHRDGSSNRATSTRSPSADPHAPETYVQ